MPHPLIAVLLASLLLPATAAFGAPGDGDWRRFTNARFGLALAYPAAIFQPDRATEEGDGNLFVSRDRKAKLLVGAFLNDEGHSPASYQRLIARQSYPGYAIDYAPVRRGWTVLSGERDGTMFYEKVIFSCANRVINSFAMTYPVAERRLYDPIIERMENTFRPGREGCGREEG